MNEDFTILDNFMTKKQNSLETQPIQMEILSVGPNLMLNLAQSTAYQLKKLDVVSAKLVDHFLDDRVLSRYNDKDKERLLMNLSELQRDKRDALIRFAELANKNDMFNKVITGFNEPSEVIEHDTGGTVVHGAPNKYLALKSIITEILDEKSSERELNFGHFEDNGDD